MKPRLTENTVQELKQLFDNKMTRHKQDKDFVKQFHMILKKEQKLAEKKQLVQEILSLIKQAYQNKTLYFNTIVDCLLYLQQREINILNNLQEAIQSACQIDKKARDIQEFEDIKIFCFQKLDFKGEREYQIQEQQKIIVFIERVIKSLQQTKKSKEDYKKMVEFLKSIPFIGQQLQVQVLICIIIQRIILNLTKDQQSLKHEFKILCTMLDDNTLHVAVNGLLTIAMTSNQNINYLHIFKACFIELFTILQKKKLTMYVLQLLNSMRIQQFYNKMVAILKEINKRLIMEHLDQTFLYERPILVIDYLPSQFLFDILSTNLDLWLPVQKYIQEHITISELYLSFTIANLAQRQSKLCNLSNFFRNDHMAIQITRKPDWFQQLKNTVSQSQEQNSENASYFSYLYCQMHLLLYLQSISIVNIYFQNSNIDVESMFFKLLVLLKLENQIFKTQENTKPVKVTGDSNQYYALEINKRLSKLVMNDQPAYYRSTCDMLQLMLKNKYKLQPPFISKLASFIQHFFKLLVNRSLQDRLTDDESQTYFIIILLLSIYTRQGFHCFIFEILNSSTRMTVDDPRTTKLNAFQVLALEEVGVYFEKLSIKDSFLQRMIVNTLQFFLRFEIPSQTQDMKKLENVLTRLRLYLQHKSANGLEHQRKGMEQIQKQYKSLMIMSVDRFLMLNGLHSSSVDNRNSKFRQFFDAQLKNNDFFMDIIILICKHSNPKDMSQNLSCLGHLYFFSLLSDLSNYRKKFTIVCYVRPLLKLDSLQYAGKAADRTGQPAVRERQILLIIILIQNGQRTLVLKPQVAAKISFRQQLYHKVVLQFIIKIIIMKHQKHICWICYQPAKNRKFKPCFCKGSLSFVHKKCLNQWVTQKYGNNFIDQLVQCPNCKYEYVFTVQEKYKLRNLSKKSFCDSIEKIVLIILTLTQIVMSSYDFISIKDYIELGSESVEFTEFKMVNFIHFGTVLIVLFAAGFNIIQMAITHTELVVQNRCN